MGTVNRIKLKRDELGVIAVNGGDVVCVPIELFIAMWNPAVSEYDPAVVDRMIAYVGGVRCNFGADGKYGVDAVTVYDKDGDEYHAVMIGGPAESYLEGV